MNARNFWINEDVNKSTDGLQLIEILSISSNGRSIWLIPGQEIQVTLMIRGGWSWWLLQETVIMFYVV